LLEATIKAVVETTDGMFLQVSFGDGHWRTFLGADGNLWRDFGGTDSVASFSPDDSQAFFDGFLLVGGLKAFSAARSSANILRHLIFPVPLSRTM
jgi:hypothetical protein